MDILVDVSFRRFKFLNYRFVFITIVVANVMFISSISKGEVWGDHIAPSITDGFDWKGLTILGVGAVATAVVQPSDVELRHKYKKKLLNEKQSELGDFLGTGIPGAAIAITQLVFDQNNGIAHTEALVTTMLSTFTLKYVNGRKRPNSSNPYSMPSGHTSTMFTTATALTYAYGWWGAIPGYTLAALTAASRVNDDAHWTSDTIAGATLGIFWGRATALHHLGLSPTVFNGGGGLIWAAEF